MKHKERKQFIRGFNREESVEGRWERLESLFSHWVGVFQGHGKKSPKEVLGTLQIIDSDWRYICDGLKPIDGDNYVTDHAWIEFFTQHVFDLVGDIEEKSKINGLIRALGYDPEVVMDGIR